MMQPTTQRRKAFILLLLCGLLCCLVLSACGDSASPETTTLPKPTLVYTGKDFTVKYLQGWSQEENANRRLVAFHSTPDKDMYDARTDSTITIGSVDTTATAQQFIEKQLLDLKTQLKDFQQVPTATTVTIAGKEWQQRSYTATTQALNGSDVTLKAVMLVTKLPDQRVFLAACGSAQSAFEQYQKQVFLPMLDTLTIKNG